MRANPQDTLEILKKFLLRFTEEIFKGYLRYKTITPQSELSEAKVKNFFFRRKVTFRSQDIQVSVVLAIPRFTKSVMS